MLILLTGADGFTGIHFQSFAAARGHCVIALKSDITDYACLALELEKLKVDAVVHLAAVSFVAHDRSEDFYKVNILGTANLLQALASNAHKPKTVLLASSGSVYGPSSGSSIAESCAPLPINHYGISKYGMELLAQNFKKHFQIIVARPFNYTGPGQSGNFVIPKLVHHFSQKAPKIVLGNIEVEREFNHVSMVCCAYLDLLEIGPLEGAFNVCSGQAHSVRKVIGVLTELTGHSPRIDFDPTLARQGEADKLYGDPTKLKNTLAAFGRTLDQRPLKDTLQEMLKAQIT